MAREAMRAVRAALERGEVDFAADVAYRNLTTVLHELAQRAQRLAEFFAAPRGALPPDVHIDQIESVGAALIDSLFALDLVAAAQLDMFRIDCEPMVREGTLRNDDADVCAAAEVQFRGRDRALSLYIRRVEFATNLLAEDTTALLLALQGIDGTRERALVLEHARGVRGLRISEAVGTIKIFLGILRPPSP